MQSFGDQMRSWSAKTGATLNQSVRAVCMDLSKRVILSTPVDTGRARANWQASLGSAAQGVVDSNDKSGSLTLRDAELTAGRAGGNVFWLTNNLPYIRTLEYGLYGTGPGATVKTTRDGYSVQAPYGMVRVSVANLRSDIDQVIRNA